MKWEPILGTFRFSKNSVQDEVSASDAKCVFRFEPSPIVKISAVRQFELSMAHFIRNEALLSGKVIVFIGKKTDPGNGNKAGDLFLAKNNGNGWLMRVCPRSSWVHLTYGQMVVRYPDPVLLFLEEFAHRPPDK